jgi:cyanophycin synthetase
LICRAGNCPRWYPALGPGFSRCDIGVITNIQEDHLGLADIHTLDDLARVKSVVINAVKKDGWAVLNADNKYCVQIGKKADCNVAYFSRNEKQPGYCSALQKRRYCLRAARTATSPL